MTKQDLIKLQGVIVDCLPNALFKVKLENGHIVNGIISGKIRKNNINILQGDKVDIEMSAYDLTKGRITFRYK